MTKVQKLGNSSPSSGPAFEVSVAVALLPEACGSGELPEEHDPQPASWTGPACCGSESCTSAPVPGRPLVDEQPPTNPCSSQSMPFVQALVHPSLASVCHLIYAAAEARDDCCTCSVVELIGFDIDMVCR